ncbi:MAG TPA: tyrosine--tRNA ligase [Victivallales bacterium]|nr:tyrosine--tRNA ligase [Victivallales bacterium]
MSTNCYEDMEARGFFYQLTDETAVKKLLNEEKSTFYVGFDPTADSLHTGHLLPVMAARRLQQAGHKPIILVGGATALVGDPSGKQEARPILSKEIVAQNAQALKDQLSNFIDFNEAIFVNNADWFSGMLYIDMLREVGTHFSVNRMLSMESVKQRMETGITFLEFNYMILQAYDFLHLNKEYGCNMQVGGQDQWGNIVSGVELVRRISGKQVFGSTFPLLTDSNGKKFGKSAGGAIWLDPSKTSIFDYYQFWRNVDDAEVGKLLFLFTSIPTEEVIELNKLEAPAINRAKEILAYEATVLAHGEEEAKKAYIAAGTKFGFADAENRIITSSKIKEIKKADCSENLPTYTVTLDELKDGKWIVALFTEAGLSKSNGDSRRLIKGGGAYLNNNRITDANLNVTLNDFVNNEAILKAGKKNIRRLIIK